MAAGDSLDAAKLREKAARLFRLAAISVDRHIGKAIWELGAELLEKSNEIEGSVDEGLETLKEESRPP